MSHFKERKEKNCLNCNAEVQGRYCHICGQENVELYETAWQLISHFVQDITHFHGKFFSSIRYLLTKPGFLSREYTLGRRTSYLHPIRMYVFTSAFFFIIFFAFTTLDEKVKNITYQGKTLQEIRAMDSLQFDVYTRTLNEGVPMTREAFEKYKDSAESKKGVDLTKAKYTTEAAYDSALATGTVKDNWLTQKFIRREIQLNQKYRNDKGELMHDFVDVFMHTFPKILFVSLPLFALLLKWLYYRHKHYFYVSHAIFGIHFYVFVFLVFLIIMIMNALEPKLPSVVWGYIRSVLELYILYYLYRSMRNFYQQGRGKTILKFILLLLMHTIVLIFLMTGFLFFTIFKI